MKKRTISILATISGLIVFACHNNNPENEHGAKMNSDSTVKKTDTVAAEPVAAPEPVKTIYGVDLSQWNGDEVAEIGPEDSLTFIICKATEGIGYKDPDFKTNMNTIRSKNAVSGCYHFYHSNEDPVKQAQFFWNTVSQAEVPQIAPVVDIEQGSLPSKNAGTAAQIQSNLKLFIEELKKLSGREPILYTGEAFGAQYLNDAYFANYRLWLAEYTGARQPIIPPTWKEKGCFIWQKKDNYTINSTQTDFDVYVGKLSDLTK